MEPITQRLIAIALGGAVGALSRYGIVLVSQRCLGDRFPLGVLLANLLGCFILGLVMHEAIVSGRWLSESGRAALTIGFLGALTTFSTFSYDTVKLFYDDKVLLAGLNVTLNCGIGFTACWLGKLAGDWIISHTVA